MLGKKKLMGRERMGPKKSESDAQRGFGTARGCRFGGNELTPLVPEQPFPPVRRDVWEK